MNPELSSFAARLRELIANRQSAIGNRQFSQLALELFALQFKHNPAYRHICAARKLPPQVVGHWTQIPAVPASAFKEMELTSLAPDERTAVFHSSGTTEQKPSRHFHNAGSLAVYETSLWAWFAANVAAGTPGTVPASFQSGMVQAGTVPGVPSAGQFQLVLLTPPPAQAPHSSLVHMFEIVRQKLDGAGAPASRTEFLGQLAPDNSWTLDFTAALTALGGNPQSAIRNPQLILGTAFSFVHLLDYLAAKDLVFNLPEGSRVMETGGYKNRSRSLPKAELHALITERLGVPRENIIGEYGMSELSSQAYATGAPAHPGHCHFPPWARVQIISPETGREVAEGETGLVRVFDLANVFSVAAIQTEDLGIRRRDGFELTGRTQLAEPRGCSLMTDSALRIPHSAIA